MKTAPTSKINHSQEALVPLKQWVSLNLYYPYPSCKEKHHFFVSSRLSKKQVHNWFVNYRIRTWPKKLAQTTGLTQEKVKVLVEILRQNQRQNTRLSQGEIEDLIADLRQGLKGSIVEKPTVLVREIGGSANNAHSTREKCSALPLGMGLAEISTQEPSSCPQPMCRSLEKAPKVSTSTYQSKLDEKIPISAIEASEPEISPPQLQSSLSNSSGLVLFSELTQIHQDGAVKSFGTEVPSGPKSVNGEVDFQPTVFSGENSSLGPCLIDTGKLPSTFPHINSLECLSFNVHEAPTVPLDGIIRDVNPLKENVMSLGFPEDENELLMRKKLEWLGQNLDKEMMGAKNLFGGDFFAERHARLLL